LFLKQEIYLASNIERSTMKVKVTVTYTTTYEAEMPEGETDREEWLLMVADSPEYQAEPQWISTIVLDSECNLIYGSGQV
jgi:hypothetical protein